MEWAIGSVDDTLTTYNESCTLTSEGSNKYYKVSELESMYLPFAFSFYADKSLEFLSNLENSVKIINDNLEIKKDRDDALNKFNVLIKELNVKYKQKKAKEEEVKALQIKYENEPVLYLVGLIEMEEKLQSLILKRRI